MNGVYQEQGELLDLPLNSEPGPTGLTEAELVEEAALAKEWKDSRGNHILNYGIEEYRLVHNFSRIVEEELSLESVLHLAPGRKAPPRNLSDYEIVALEAEGYRHSSHSTTTPIKVEGVELDYDGNGKTPFIDTSFAAGLVHKGTLSALAAAYITPSGSLSIVQLQSVAPPPDPDRGIDKYSSGLHGGFLWRDTLVQAWIEIARDLGIDTVEIQGAENNTWVNPPPVDERKKADEWRKRFFKGYDEVADRMGFIKNDEGDWDLDISAEKFTLADVALAGDIGKIIRE